MGGCLRKRLEGQETGISDLAAVPSLGDLVTGQVTQRMTRHEVIVAEPGGLWIGPGFGSTGGDGVGTDSDGCREWKNWG